MITLYFLKWTYIHRHWLTIEGNKKIGVGILGLGLGKIKTRVGVASGWLYYKWYYVFKINMVMLGYPPRRSFVPHWHPWTRIDWQLWQYWTHILASVSPSPKETLLWIYAMNIFLGILVIMIIVRACVKMEKVTGMGILEGNGCLLFRIIFRKGWRRYRICGLGKYVRTQSLGFWISGLCSRILGIRSSGLLGDRGSHWSLGTPLVRETMMELWALVRSG